ncbi:MAG: hypothetical protein HRF47_05945 [Chloroflexota bacterium]|jgi:hypothetical protein
MIRALLDTNVILDTLLAREPSGVQAAAVWQAHGQPLCGQAISATVPFYSARFKTAIISWFHLVGHVPHGTEMMNKIGSLIVDLIADDQ